MMATRRTVESNPTTNIVSMPRRPRTHIKQFVMSMLKFVSHTLFLVQTNHKWVDWNKKIFFSKIRWGGHVMPLI